MAKELTQIMVEFVSNVSAANEALRTFQRENPQRKIIGVSMVPNEPQGWFMTITYTFLF